MNSVTKIWAELAVLAIVVVSALAGAVGLAVAGLGLFFIGEKLANA